MINIDYRLEYPLKYTNAYSILQEMGYGLEHPEKLDIASYLDALEDALCRCFDAYRSWCVRSDANKIKQKTRNIKCKLCGCTNSVELHHIMPVSAGGDNSDENLIWLCDKHHRALHSLMPFLSDKLSIEIKP